MPTIIEGLKTRVQYQSVASSGKKWITPGFILQMASNSDKLIPNEETAPIRIGYTVSKKVGCAVVRNKIKRRLRAAANNVLATKKFAGNDYVFIGRKEAQYRKFNSLVSDINWAIKRLNKSEEI